MSSLDVPTFRCPKCSRDIPTVNEVIHSIQCRGAAGAVPAVPHHAPTAPPVPASPPAHEASEVDVGPVSTSSPGDIPMIVIDSDSEDDEQDHYHHHHDDDSDDYHDFGGDSDDDIEFIEMENNSWPCRACTLLNDAHATRCQLCNTSRFEEDPRPSRPSSSSSRRSPAGFAAPPEPSRWKCGRCTYENAASMPRCEMCGDGPRVVPRVHYGMIDDRTDETDLLSPIFVGAGLGAGAAMLNGRSVMRGAAEGAGMGLLGGLLLNSMQDDLRRRHSADDDHERMILHDMIMPRHFMGGFPMAGHTDEPQGVSRDLLGQLPTRTFRSETDRPDQCSICLENFKNREKVKTLPCLHQFHEKCVDPWLRGHNTCPVCKHQIR